ncbi:MAG: dienelactone hydrolase family protein [Gammaproteobacteria bacterium]
MKIGLFLLIPFVCFACASSPAPEAAPTAPHHQTSSHPANIATETIEYTVNGTPFTGFLAYDKAMEGRRPGVIVVHEWWGHNAYARSRAVQLAKLGYTAFALDMYGSGQVTDHPDEAMQFMKESLKNNEQVKARFLKAKAILQEQTSTNPDQIAAIGYCFGGGVVLNMARAGVDLDGIISFHGTLAPLFTSSPGTIKARILVLNAAGANYTFISYPNAQHAFTNPNASELGSRYHMPIAYNQQADTQSWHELQQFLASLWPHD